MNFYKIIEIFSRFLNFSISEIYLKNRLLALDQLKHRLEHARNSRTSKERSKLLNIKIENRKLNRKLSLKNLKVIVLPL